MKVLNIGIVAHVDAGKTSLAERILYDLEITRKLGKIEDKNTQLDSMTMEKERGITIKNSYISFVYDDVKINLIDTPGHFDFIDEVESVFDVLDAVVLVVSALDGVQSQTKKLWNLAKEYQLPTIIYTNKADIYKDTVEVLNKSIETFLTSHIFRLNPEVFYDTLEYLPDDIYLLAEKDPLLEDTLLADEIPTKEQITRSLLSQFVEGSMTPLIYGSARQGIGIDLLLQMIAQLDISRDTNALSLVVYKIEYDKQFGKSAYVQIKSGVLHTKDRVEFTSIQGSKTEEKISMMYQNIAGKRENVEMITAGDIGIIYGVHSLQVGDYVGEISSHKHKKTPSLFLVTLQENSGRIMDLKKAVHELSEEHPAMEYQWFEEMEELQISVIGKMQSDIICGELEEYYGLDITATTPTIIYKETPTKLAIGYERYTMPKPCWAVVQFEIEPLDDKNTVEILIQSDNDKLLPRYHSQIENAIYSTLQQGRLGWEVTGLKITLVDGESHKEHTHPLDFALATPIAIQDGLSKAEMILLEPTLLFCIEADLIYASQIMADVFAIEGEIILEEYTDHLILIHAIIPLATSTDYISEFFKNTKGNGSVHQEFYGYQPCPSHRFVTNLRKGVDPLDRDKWILHRRGALG